MSRPNTHWNPSLCWFKVLHIWGTQEVCSWRASNVHYDASLLWSSCWVIWADLHVPIRCCQEADAGIAYCNPFTLLVARELLFICKNLSFLKLFNHIYGRKKLFDFFPIVIELMLFGLKVVLCIRELSLFKYTPLSVFFKTFSLRSKCIKILTA